MKKVLLILVLMLGLVFDGFADIKKKLDFNGSAYSDLGLYHWVTSGTDSAEFTGLSDFNFIFKNTNCKHAKIEGDFDLTIPYGLNEELLNQDNYISTSDSNLNIPKAAAINFLFDIRKLYMSLYLPWVDITAGRQIVNFGKGYVFSPIDVFSNIEISDINFRRKGSDVFIVKIPVGDLSGVDMFIEAPTNEKEFTGAVRAFTNLGTFDFSAIGLYRFDSEEIIAGVDFKGDVELGVYGEFVAHYDKSDWHLNYFEFMLGLDYSLPWDITVQAEYYYNGNGFSSENNLLQISDLSLGKTFYRKHYGYFGFSQSINELSMWNANVIYNFDTQAFMATAMYSQNILQNVDILFYVRSYYNWMKDIEGIEQIFSFPDLSYNLRLELKF